MDAEKMQNHIKHLEEKHRIINIDIDAAEGIGYFNDESMNLTEMKKERLRLKDEIERCRHQLEGMLK